jgi:hypothetical protein
MLVWELMAALSKYEAGAEVFMDFDKAPSVLDICEVGSDGSVVLIRSYREDCDE